MLENVTVGSDLMHLVATDNDHGPDGVVSYHIDSVTTSKCFTVSFIVHCFVFGDLLFMNCY